MALCLLFTRKTYYEAGVGSELLLVRVTFLLSETWVAQNYKLNTVNAVQIGPILEFVM